MCSEDCVSLTVLRGRTTVASFAKLVYVSASQAKSYLEKMEMQGIVRREKGGQYVVQSEGLVALDK